MTQSKAVTIKECCQILQMLERLFSHALGPNGKRTLVTTSSGSVLMSCDGNVVLDSLNVSHPIARWLSNCILQHHQVCGDNSKMFILILSSFMKQIYETYPKVQGSYSNEREFCGEVAVHIDYLIDKFIPDVIQPRLSSCLSVASNAGSIMCVKRLMQSFIGGKVPSKVSQHLTELLIKFLFTKRDENMNIYEKINNVIDNFSLLCTEASGKTVFDSYVMDGVILSRNFAFPKIKKSQPAIYFVILKFDFGESCTTKTKSTMHLSGFDNLFSVMGWKLKKYEAFLQKLVSCKINLILSTENFPVEVLSLCEQKNVDVIHSLPAEEVEHLCNVCRINALYDFSDDLSDRSVGEATGISIVELSGKLFPHLSVKSEEIFLRHLVICGPSVSFTRMFSSILLNGLKMLRFNLIRNSESDLRLDESKIESPQASAFRLIPAGGWSELVAARLLQEREFTDSNKILCLVENAFRQAVLVVPQTLYSNSYQRDNKKFVEVFDEWWKLFTTGTVTSLDFKSGALQVISEKSAVESLAGKIYLYESVLETAKQLLRLERIIGVKRNAERNMEDIEDM